MRKSLDYILPRLIERLEQLAKDEDGNTDPKDLELINAAKEIAKVIL